MNEERPHRQEKIAELLKREVGRVITETVDFGEALVTVSQVVLSPNHQHADVLVTVLPFEKGEEIIEVLQDEVRDVQHTLNRALRMRPVPKLTFKLDPSEEQAQKITDLLKD